jgi:hypothetical protein
MHAPPSLGDQPGLFSPLSFWWPLVSALRHGLSPVPPAQPHIINSIITIKRISFYCLKNQKKKNKHTFSSTVALVFSTSHLAEAALLAATSFAFFAACIFALSFSSVYNCFSLQLLGETLMAVD